MRVPIRSLATLVLAVGVATCADAPTVGRARTGATAGARGRGTIAMAPVFSQTAAAVYAQRATFAAASFDHVRIVLVRPGPPADTLRDTTIVFAPGSAPQTVEFTVDVATANEAFTGAFDYTNNGQVVYHGATTVIAHALDQPAPPQQDVVITYVGPGASVTRLVVAPKTVTVVAPGSATFTATGFDASNAAVANNPVSWSVSDPTVATISAAGVLSTTGKRGVVTVSATSIAGPSDGASATVTLPPAAIALVSGGGQTGKAGVALPQSASVKVTATDGVGVAGVTVTFAAPTGGAVGSSSATTDPNGVATTSLTLGGAVGPQSFAAVAGTFSVSIPATATPGDPTAVVTVSGSGQQDTVKKAVGALVVKVTDKFANAVPGVTVSWARTAGTGALSGSSSVTGADGTASIGYTLGTTPGVETITASVSGVTGGASFSVTALPAGPTAIASAGGGGQTGRAQQALGAPFVVKVTDASGNGVAGVSVSWSATNGTISPTTTTDADGQSSNTLTLGATLGNASATATIGSGATAKSVTFTVTVQAGVVAQLAFRTGPPATMAVGAVLAPPIVIELRDAAGNLTAATNAVTIALGANPGKATLGGTQAVNAVAGAATFNDLTVSIAGNGYTLVASSAGVANVTSATFNVTGTAPPGPSGTWAGTVSTDWFVAGNWGGNVVPTASTNVTIPAGVEYLPVLTANAVAADVTVAPNASLSLGAFTLTTGGNVDGGTGPGITGAGSLVMTGPSKTFRGAVSNLSVNGTISLSGAGVVTGNASVVSGGTFAVNQTLTVAGSLSASGTSSTALATIVVAPGAVASAASLSTSGASGIFSQTGGSLTVLGAATFGGNNAGNLITAGTLVVGGDFTQTGNVTTASFAATGTHLVVLNGTQTQNVNFANSTSSHFQNLSLSNSGTLVITTTGGALTATGQLTSPAGATAVQSAGRTIAAAGLDVDGLTLDNTVITSTGGTITRFDNVTFQNYAATATPLTITHPGAASGFTFNNTQFLVTPTSGRYLNVTDSNPNDAQPLTITMLNSVPADGSAQTATAGGALVNWTTSGATIAWTNASGGSWSVPSNWSLGRVPGAGDAVVVALSGTYTVTIDTTYTGKSIVVGAAAGTQTLSISNRTLSLSNAMTVQANGVFAPNSSTLAGAATLTNNGTVNLFYSTIATPLDNRGLLNANGTSGITGSITTSAASIVRLSPDNTTGFSNLTFANGFTNNGAIELTSFTSTYSSTLTVTAGTLTNAAGATISSLVGAGGTRTLNAQFNNQGTITVVQPLVLNRTSSVYTNSGAIDATATDFTVNQGGTSPSFTNSGTITIGAGHVVTFSGGTFNQNAGTISGPGTVALSSTTANFSTNFTNATTALTISSSTVNGPGSLTNAAGKTLTLLYGTINAPLDNQGTLIANGTTGINAAFTTSAASIVRLLPDGTTGFSNLTFANGFTNNGTIELTSFTSTYSSTLTVTAGTLTNAAGATISSLVGAGGTRTLNAQFNNQGTITVVQPLVLNRTSSVYTNSGAIDATATDFTVNQGGTSPSFTNSGSVTTGAGHTVTISGGTFNQSAGTIGGAGTLALTNTTANFTTNFTNATTALTVSSSTVNGPGSLTNAAGKTLTLLYGTVNAPLDNQGTLIANGTTGINVAFTTSAASIVRLLPDGSTGFSNLTFANSFTNNGTIELTSTLSSYSSTLTMTAGTLTNAAGATITSLVGAGGTRTLNAQFDNQGTITVLQPLVLSRASSVYTNSGTIDGTAADVTLNQSGTTPSFTNSGAITTGAGHTITISGGTFNQSAGTIGGAGTVALTNTTANFTTNFTNATTALTLSSATVNGPGTFTNAAGKTLTMYYSTFGPTASLTNQGTIVANGTSGVSGAITTVAGSIIRLQPDGSTGFSNFTLPVGFTNNGAIELTSTVSSYSATLIVPGNMTNASTGTITTLPGTGGTRTITAQLDNQGLITVNQALTLNRGSTNYSNSGTINLAGGDLLVQQSGTTPSFTNTGTMNVASGQTWSITSGTLTEQVTGTLSGAGALSINGVTAVFNTGFSFGTFATISSTVTLAQNLSSATTALTINGSTINGPGTITNPAGQTFNMNGTTIAATSALINQGTLIVNGTNNINGPFTNAYGAILRLQPDGSTGFSTFTLPGSFTNDGGIEMTATVSSYSASFVLTTGTLTNSSTGTITTLVGTGGTRTITAQLDNQGVITINQALTLNRASSAHTNSGTINLAGGDLLLQQSGTTPSFTNTGTVNVPAGRTWSVTSGALTQQAAGTLSGTGALSMNGVTAVFNTGFSFGTFASINSTVTLAQNLSTATTALTINGSTINGPGTITNAASQTFNMNGTTIAATSALINQGTLIVNGTSNINGPFTNANGATLRLQPDGSTGFSTFTLPSSFTNDGAIEMTATVSSYSATFSVNSGTFTNSSTGTITTLVGTGGTRTLSAALNNLGVVTVNQPLSMTRSNSAHTNTGTINVNAALSITQAGAPSTFTTSGTVTIAPGQTFTVSGGTFTQQATGAINGGGNLSVNNAVGTFNNTITVGALNFISSNITFQAGVSTGGASVINSSTINGPAALTNVGGQTLTLQNATFASGSSLVNQGVVVVHGNSSAMNGSYSNAAGATLRVEGESSQGTASLTFGNGVGFTNNGAVELTSTASFASALAMGAGTLSNASGATITSFVASGGARSITGTVNNAGSITIASGGTGTLAIGALTNSGTVNVKLNGTGAGQFDVLAVTGAATLGVGGPSGIMNVSLVSGFTPSTGNSFKVMTYASHSQSFLTTNFPPGAWTSATNAGDITLTAP